MKPPADWDIKELGAEETGEKGRLGLGYRGGVVRGSEADKNWSEKKSKTGKMGEQNVSNTAIRFFCGY